VWSIVPIAVTLVGWFWPKSRETREHREVEQWQTEP
jgi:hypothetical protein